ncbi:MAG: DUF4160 domain-containing protein, partial [Gemmatimonadetes bacterium]|nr:DUF4160 domain-containing protein [Gemmatimonadota bacterium]
APTSGWRRGLERHPGRALRHVLEWAALHRAELLANWQRARQGEAVRHIAPLE